MGRPYIICHMVTSLDGKVTGDFLGKEAYGGLIEGYYRIHRDYGADGFLCGRITMESSFPQPPIPPTMYEGPPVARVDYVAEKVPFYGVAIDLHGKLRWNNSVISDLDDGYNGAHIIEVLTEDVSEAFLAHLRSKGVSYLFGGKAELNLALVAQKLRQLFGIKKLLLEGGGIVNGSFIQAGLIDEIRLVVVPAAEPSEKAVPLFQTNKYQIGDRAESSFRLEEAQKLDHGGLWLTY